VDKESKKKMDELGKLSEIVQHLKRYDRWRRSQRSIESATNWVLQ